MIPTGSAPATRPASPYAAPTGSASALGDRLAAIYSHSRLSSFENCPKQFEFRYVQKIPSETESIEAFVGKRVHEILERLYLFVGRGQLPGVEKVVDRYQKLWEETFDAERVRVVREGTPVAYYRELGERCLRSYYVRHYPFDDGETLGLERRVVFPLDEDGRYKMQGIIDRISRARDGVIEVHDYKTGARVPSQSVLDQDRQLALYQIGLAREYGEDTPFRLVWHYVAKNRTCTSTRRPEELERLRHATIERIDEIRAATEYPAKKIALCGWCEYQSICPAWNPEAALAPAGEPMAEPAAQTTGRTEATPDSGGAEADGASGGVQLDLL